MIAKITYGNRFGGLSKYLMEGKNNDLPGQESPKKSQSLTDYLTGDNQRVGGVDFRNTMKSTPAGVAVEMEELSKLSNRTEKPVMHMSLSFHEQDEVSKDEMKEIMHQTLDRLGLGEHKVMTVIHSDTDHPHIHAMISRIHPETHKAWTRDFDYRRSHEIARSIEKERGLTPVKMPHEVDGKSLSIGQVKESERIEQYAQKMEIKDLDNKTITDDTIIERGRRQYDDLMEAKNFAEFDNILAREGLYIDQAGPGSKITDGLRSVKSSSVSRDFGIQSLEKRFDQKLKEYVKDRDSLVKEYETKNLQQLWNDFQVMRDKNSLFFALNNDYHRHHNTAEQIRKYIDDRNRQVKGIARSFDTMYADGLGSHDRFQAKVNREGFNKALDGLRDNPKQFGVLTGEFRKGRLNKADLIAQVSNSYDGISKVKLQYPELKGKSYQEIKKLFSESRGRMIDLGKKLDEMNAGGIKSLNNMKQNFTGAINKSLSKTGLSQSKATRDLQSSTMLSISLAKDAAKMAGNPAGGALGIAKKVALRALKQAIRQGRSRGRGL